MLKMRAKTLSIMAWLKGAGLRGEPFQDSLLAGGIEDLALGPALGQAHLHTELEPLAQELYQLVVERVDQGADSVDVLAHSILHPAGGPPARSLS